MISESLIELKVSQKISAVRCKRSAEAQHIAMATAAQIWETQVGGIALCVPKLQEGSYFPSLLEPGHRALLTVVQRACILTVSRCNVDEVLRALNCAGVNESTFSRFCHDSEDKVQVH